MPPCVFLIKLSIIMLTFALNLTNFPLKRVKNCFIIQVPGEFLDAAPPSDALEEEEKIFH